MISGSCARGIFTVLGARAAYQLVNGRHLASWAYLPLQTFFNALRSNRAHIERASRPRGKGFVGSHARLTNLEPQDLLNALVWFRLLRPGTSVPLKMFRTVPELFRFRFKRVLIGPRCCYFSVRTGLVRVRTEVRNPLVGTLNEPEEPYLLASPSFSALWVPIMCPTHFSSTNFPVSFKLCL